MAAISTLQTPTHFVKLYSDSVVNLGFSRSICFPPLVSRSVSKSNNNKCSYQPKKVAVSARSVDEKIAESTFSAPSTNRTKSSALLSLLDSHGGIPQHLAYKTEFRCFFFSVFWGFYPLYNAVFTFPQEKKNDSNKEAIIWNVSPFLLLLSQNVWGSATGASTLNSFVFIIFWVGDLKSDPLTFVRSLLVVLYSVLVAQSLGFGHWSILMDVKQVTTLAFVTTLVFLMAGGYVLCSTNPNLHNLASVFELKLLLGVQYDKDDYYERSKGVLCRVGDFPAVKSKGLNHLWKDVSIRALMLVGCRLVAYMALLRVPLR